MLTDEDYVKLRQWIKIGMKEVAPAEGNAWRVVTTCVGVEKLSTLGVYFESDHL